ncbi:hypothetical protein Fmac_025743 [Flemingia macrophylla]|uniref:Uncharacterized protein n=1 Tax=Flemingia macrophylla TaxID=520843 RepID=A0ABD1LT27_9FABA
MHDIHSSGVDICNIDSCTVDSSSMDACIVDSFSMNSSSADSSLCIISYPTKIDSSSSDVDSTITALEYTSGDSIDIIFDLASEFGITYDFFLTDSGCTCDSSFHPEMRSRTPDIYVLVNLCQAENWGWRDDPIMRVFFARAFVVLKPCIFIGLCGVVMVNEVAYFCTGLCGVETVHIHHLCGGVAFLALILTFGDISNCDIIRMLIVVVVTNGNWFNNQIGNAILSCPQVLFTVAPCLGYLRGPGGEVPSLCCYGVNTLNNEASNTPDHQ